MIWRLVIITLHLPPSHANLHVINVQDQELLPPALQLLPPTKTREPDAALRLMHVETLLLLCHTRWGRDYLRGNGVYEIVRVMHEGETVDKVRLRDDAWSLRLRLISLIDLRTRRAAGDAPEK